MLLFFLRSPGDPAPTGPVAIGLPIHFAMGLRRRVVVAQAEDLLTAIMRRWDAIVGLEALQARLNWMKPPTKVNYPYAVLTDLGPTPNLYDTGSLYQETNALQFAIFTDDYLSAKAYAALVRDAFNRSKPAFTDGYVIEFTLGGRVLITAMPSRQVGDVPTWGAYLVFQVTVGRYFA